MIFGTSEVRLTKWSMNHYLCITCETGMPGEISKSLFKKFISRTPSRTLADLVKDELAEIVKTKTTTKEVYE